MLRISLRAGLCDAREARRLIGREWAGSSLRRRHSVHAFCEYYPYPTTYGPSHYKNLFSYHIHELPHCETCKEFTRKAANERATARTVQRKTREIRRPATSLHLTHVSSAYG